ncbi:MAG: MgtC/SapB family protein [Polyangia bacterium]
MIPDPLLEVGTTAIALRTGAAVLSGTLLGINRDLHHKSAGVRTHSLVSLGSAMVVMLAFTVDSRNGDGATRVMQGLVTGIGFLGAGVILHRETKKRIEGLTTAASIWVAAAFGMACGAGRFVLVGITLTAALVVLVLGGPLEKWLERVFHRKDDAPESGPPSD